MLDYTPKQTLQAVVASCLELKLMTFLGSMFTVPLNLKYKILGNRYFNYTLSPVFLNYSVQEPGVTNDSPDARAKVRSSPS